MWTCHEGVDMSSGCGRIMKVWLCYVVLICYGDMRPCRRVMVLTYREDINNR
jgi:hypothetical protein